MAYIPIFYEIKDRICLVVGGGSVAYRKIRALLDFEAKVVCVAEQVCEDVLRLSEAQESGRLDLICTSYEPADCDGKALVIAATDDVQLNHRIAEYCKDRGILVNAVDQKEDCSFIFPAYVRERNLVAAFSSSGNSPVIAQYLKEQERDILTPLLAELNEYMGEWRPQIQAAYRTMEERKYAYQRILQMTLDSGRIPGEDEIKAILEGE